MKNRGVVSSFIGLLVGLRVSKIKFKHDVVSHGDSWQPLSSVALISPCADQDVAWFSQKRRCSLQLLRLWSWRPIAFSEHAFFLYEQRRMHSEDNFLGTFKGWHAMTETTT